MQTSLNELRLIEDYLFCGCEEEERCLFEAKLILQPELKENVYWQKKTYQIVQNYGRKQLKSEIEQVHETLFNTHEHRSFRQRIMRLFNK